MKICPVPWMPPVDETTIKGLPLRPILVQGSNRPARFDGFRDLSRAVSGEPNSFELPRPLLVEGQRAVRLHGSALTLSVKVGGSDEQTGDEAPLGIILASRAAAISAWLSEAQGASCKALRDRLRAEFDSADAPESLVVEIARRHRYHIESVCREPRVQLRRRRELQLVDRVRNLDAASLRWLARQPGTSIEERAGPRERILAVRRFRSADTLENQVLLDVVRRSIALSQQYGRLYRRYQSSERVRLVRDLSRGMKELLEEPWTEAVRKIAGIPTPNYALLSDRRYAPIWRLWQRILRQEQLFQSLEAWMPRLVAELAWIGCLAEIEELEKSSPWRTALGGLPPLQFRPEFESGEFVLGQQAMPPLWRADNGDPQRIDLARGDQLASLSAWARPLPIWDPVQSLRPDFVFMARRGGSSQTALLVWTLAIWTDQDRVSLQEALPSLAAQVHRSSGMGGTRIVPWLLAFDAGARIASPVGCPAGVNLRVIRSMQELLTTIPSEIVVQFKGLNHAA
jgi:hypothetical protein